MAISICNILTDESGRELTSHGTSVFPSACYCDDLTSEEISWHWHDEIEIIVVTEGEMIVAAGSERYTLPKGYGCFINAGTLHAAWNNNTGSCMLHSVVFHPRLAGGSIDSVFWQKYLNPLLTAPSLSSVFFDPALAWQQEAMELLEDAWRAQIQEDRGYEFTVREKVSRILFLLTFYHPTSAGTPTEKQLRDSGRMKMMLQFIHEHYSEEISTDAIAASAMISSSECLRCFRSTIGATPIQYVKQYRISCAASLLLSTQKKISEIAAQCGFGEMSYFAKAFRESRGCTPSSYRLNKGAVVY